MYFVLCLVLVIVVEVVIESFQLLVMSVFYLVLQYFV
jgi:hypothetical protein